MKRINFTINDPLAKRLEQHAAQTGLAVSDLIRRAIEAFLKKEQK